MMRESRRPEIIVFEVDRLQNHTNADDQRMYRTPEEIEAVWQSGDPIVHTRNYLTAEGVSQADLDRMNEEVRTEVREEAYKAQRSPDPTPVHTAVKTLEPRFYDPAAEYRGSPAPEGQAGENGTKPIVMLEAIRETLNKRLEQDSRVQLFGEDIEDPKGDVFGVTRGLTERYPGRVRNSPLAEASIIGVSVGQALAGKRPVAFLQFADFLPIAFNQIWAELGSMWWRSDGAWQAPVIVMITCGAYKPGLGPFHASSLEALAAHTPGIDVFMPATAGDAAGMLNAAFESERPTLFFYPKSLLNDRANATSPDVAKHFVPLGKARTVREGTDITLVGWGNTVGLCDKAAASLADVGVKAEVIDLRSIVPWDVDAVVESAEKTGRLIVVHEDNHTAGFGGEVVASVAERSRHHIDMRRVTRADTYVPCNFGNQLEVLPSYKRTLETAVDMLGGEIHWKLPEAAQKGTYLVEAIGSSPSDESITVIEWHIEPGQEIASGEIVADLEADKAAVELRAPIDGTVAELLVEQGDMVKVGTPIIKLKTEESDAEGSLKQPTREEPGEPIITGLEAATVNTAAHAPAPRSGVATARAGSGGTQEVTIGLAGISGVKGSRLVTNEEIVANIPDWDSDDVVKRTGIETRYWFGEGENGVTLGVAAARKLLGNLGLARDDIDMIIVATETPTYHTPSMSTLIQMELAEGQEYLVPAYDVNAACTGYLYALQNAYDMVHTDPEQSILVVTTESLSPRVDPKDPGTAPIFGDAATATLVTAAEAIGGRALGRAGGRGVEVPVKLHRPYLGASGEDGSLLKVPSDEEDKIFMNGPKVFVEAVRDLVISLRQAAEIAGIGEDDLDLIVPHQANQRIINAVRQRMKVPPEKMYSNIRYNGNTSSSTIPLCLEEIFPKDQGHRYLGLTAFGGGFTFGGAVLELPR
jgi:2-oxoisovalerate dehydrogenase E1 component